MHAPSTKHVSAARYLVRLNLPPDVRGIDPTTVWRTFSDCWSSGTLKPGLYVSRDVSCAQLHALVVIFNSGAGWRNRGCIVCCFHQVDNVNNNDNRPTARLSFAMKAASTQSGLWRAAKNGRSERKAER